MAKYLVKRIIRGIISVIIVVGIVMLLIYSLMDRDLVLAADPNYTRLGTNDKTMYKYSLWEQYGYLDYVPYGDYLVELAKNGEIDDDTRASAALLANNAKDDNAIAKEYTQKFTDYYKSQGYTVSRLKGVNVKGGNPGLFAYKDIHLLKRLWNYFANIIEVDSIHYAEEAFLSLGTIPHTAERSLLPPLSATARNTNICCILTISSRLFIRISSESTLAFHIR